MASVFFLFDCGSMSAENAMNPYVHFIASFARLITSGKSLPLGGIPPHHPPNPRPTRGWPSQFCRDQMRPADACGGRAQPQNEIKPASWPAQRRATVGISKLFFLRFNLLHKG
jgi:hypothetical protein